MNDEAGVWRELGIDPTGDARAIRRAYAQRLKQTHPEDDAEGFQRLRSAYEHASHLAAQQQLAQQAPVEEVRAATGETPPESAPAGQSQAVDETLDPELQFISETFNSLFARLHGAEPHHDEEANLLRELLAAPAMDRLEVLQRAEFGLAEQLARSVPRSDHLLEAAAQRFNWRDRWFDRDLSQAARFIVVRLNDREQLQALQGGKSEMAQGFARLQLRVPTWRLWLRSLAYRDKPEIAVIQLLRDQHPNLLGSIPEENLQWWDRYASRPPLSTTLFWTGIVAASLVLFFGFLQLRDAGRTAAIAALISLGLGVLVLALFALVMFGRHLLFDVPVHEVAKRWGSVPPLGVALGWVPAGVVLMVFTLLLRNFPVIAWIPAGVGCLAVLWASYLAGPIVRARFGGNIMDLRSVRAVGVNILAIFWVLLCASEETTTITRPAMVSLLTPLAASGVALATLMDFFEHRLSSRAKGWFLLAALVCGLLVGALVVFLGNDPAWYPLLAPCVVFMVVLKRTIPPNRIFSSGNGLMVLGALGAYLAVAGVIAVAVGIQGDSETPVAVLATGALFLLLGVIVDFAVRGIRHWRDGRRQRV